MICQQCGKNQATFHVTEVDQPDPADAASQEVREQHVCEICAQELDLPHSAVQTKTMADVWKLLQISAQQARRRKRSTLQCPQCKMTLEELRSRGRLGCPNDYEVFKEYLGELFERMHGSRLHIGRVPGLGETELARIQRVSDLKQELDQAIREEAYERAAALRDELQGLETQAEAGG